MRKYPILLLAFALLLGVSAWSTAIRRLPTA